MLEEKDLDLIQQMIRSSVIEEVEKIKKSQSTLDDDRQRLLLNDSVKMRMKTYEQVLNKELKNPRKAKVLFTNAGGSASKGSQTTRITLPITWVREMGITPEDREVDICFQDGKIIIQKNI